MEDEEGGRGGLETIGLEVNPLDEELGTPRQYTRSLLGWYSGIDKPSKELKCSSKRLKSAVQYWCDAVHQLNILVFLFSSDNVPTFASTHELNFSRLNSKRAW